MSIFTFWDFVKPGEEGETNKSLIRPYDACVMAEAAFEKYLKTYGKFVWGFKNKTGWYESKHIQDESHFTGYVINIKETLNACKHSKERVKCVGNSINGEAIFKCECGKEMKPTAFAEKY